LDSIALGKGKGTAGATKAIIPKRYGKFSQALLTFTVLSLGYVTNHIGRTSLQTGPSSRNL
jgi:hypothetical protein